MRCLVERVRDLYCCLIASDVVYSYSEHNVTDAEFEMLPARLKEQVRRTGQARANPQWQGMYTPGSAPAAGATAFKRYGTPASTEIIN